MSSYFYRHLLDLNLARSDLQSASLIFSRLLDSLSSSGLHVNANLYHGLLSLLSDNISGAQDEFQKALKSGLNQAEQIVIYFQLFLLSNSILDVSKVKYFLLIFRWKSTLIK